jgi:hypothetical protein
MPYEIVERTLPPPPPESLTCSLETSHRSRHMRKSTGKVSPGEEGSSSWASASTLNTAWALGAMLPRAVEAPRREVSWKQAVGCACVCVR